MARKKTNGLVLEYLERVSGSLLEDQYRPVIAKMIRGHAGIYALYKADKLYYVGLASNLMGRVKQHLKDRHTRRWDTFSVYLAGSNDHIKPLESLLLRIVQPGGNRVKGKLTGAKDQSRGLHKAMSDADSNRRASLLGGRYAQNRMRRKTASSSGTVVLAGLVTRRIPLQAEYKGERYRATLRKDGYIAYRGALYASPAAAAKAVIGRSGNGWSFWHYRAGAKGWVRLAQLKK